MTGQNDKLRGLLLAALMVLSVFASTVALSGGAYAAGNSKHSVDSAVENGGNIEIVFSDGVLAGNGDVLDPTNFTVTINDSDHTPNSVTREAGDQGNGEDVRFTLEPGSNWNDLDPVDDVTVTIDKYRADAGAGAGAPGNSENVTNTKVTVDVTSTELDTDDGSFDTKKNAAELYRGEVIAQHNPSNEGDGFTVRDVTDNEVVQSGSLTNNATMFAFDTDHSKVDAGNTYKIEWDSASNQWFNVSSLQLSASGSDVKDDEALKVDVSAIQGGRLIDVELKDSDGNEVDTKTITLGSTNGEATADFGTQSKGTYSATATDHKTTTTADTGDISVTKAASVDVEFVGNGVFNEHVGDVAEINVSMTNTDEATVTIGSKDQNYYLRANVTDDSGDGYVEIAFNTFTAGGSNADPANVSWVTDGSDTLENITQGGSFNASDEVGANMLDASEYDLNMTDGHVGPGYAASDAGTLSLDSRSTDGMNVWTAPSDDDVSGYSASDLADGMGINVTTASDIADEDWIIHQMNVSGIEGALENRSGDDTSSFWQEVNASHHSQFNFSSAEVSPGVNASPNYLDLNESNAELIADADNDRYYLAVDTSNLNYTGDAYDVADGDFEGDFTVNGSAALADDDETVNNTYDIVTRDASITLNADDEVDVEAADNQTVSASSSVAPGTELQIKMDSESSTNPFVKNPTGDVAPDGIVTVTENFADDQPGTNFTLQVKDFDGDKLGDEENGQIVSSTAGTATPEPGTDEPTPKPGTATTEPSTPTPEPSTPTPEPDTPTDEPEDPGTETPGQGPGFGVAISLVALIAAALLALRREQ